MNHWNRGQKNEKSNVINEMKSSLFLEIFYSHEKRVKEKLKIIIIGWTHKSFEAEKMRDWVDKE